MQGLLQGELFDLSRSLLTSQDLCKSGRSVQEDWPEFASYARTHGSHFQPLLSLPSEPNSPQPQSDEAPARRSSDIISPARSPILPSSPPQKASRGRSDTESRGPNDFAGFSASGQPQRDRPSAAPTTGSSRMSIRERWADRKQRAPTVIARDRAIQKAALAESAEKIYLRYLLPGAEREIYLP